MPIRTALSRYSVRLLIPLALAVSALLAPPAEAALVTHFSQATYDVDVDPASDLLGWLGFSGTTVTAYSTAAATTGTGIILEAYPGEYRTLTQRLILRFTADPGYRFTTVEFSHLLSYGMVEGGYTAQMSWSVTPVGGTTQTGSTGVLSNGAWFVGGSFNDPTQPSPVFAIDAAAFDLDVTLYYSVSGYPGGCSSASGVCATLSANSVKVWASTTQVPEPGSAALVGIALGAVALRRRR